MGDYTWYLTMVVKLVEDGEVDPETCNSGDVMDVLRDGGIVPRDAKFERIFCKIWKNFVVHYFAQLNEVEAADTETMLSWFSADVPPAVHENMK